MLANGALAVATVSPELLTLEIVIVGGENPSSIPVHGLVGYDLSTLGDDWVIAWSERQEGLSSLWLQVEEQSKMLVAEGTDFIDDITTTRDGYGNLYLAWAGGSQGSSGIFFSKYNAVTREITPPRQLTFGGPKDRLPSLVAHANIIHLTYKREFVLHAEVRYQRFTLGGDQASSVVIIAETGRDVDDLPLLALQADGSKLYFWLRPSIVRGQAGQSRLLKGHLTADGAVTSSLVPIFEFGGHSASLALAYRDAKGQTLVWLNDESGTFQAYYLVIDVLGQIGEHGPVTNSRGHKFATEVQQGDRKIVLFYELQGEYLAVMYAEDIPSTEKPFVAHLGLDPENPLLDAFYILISRMVGSLGLTALSSLLLIPLIGLLSLLPPLRLRHYTALWVTFSIVLGIVAQPYMGTVLIPGHIGLSIMAGAALMAWSILYLARLDRSDLVTLGAFGHIYAFCLFFASLFF